MAESGLFLHHLLPWTPGRRGGMAQVACRPASAAQRLRTWFPLLPPAVPTLASPQVRQPVGSSTICFLVHRQGSPPPPLPLKRQCRTPTFHPPPLPSGVTCQGQCRRAYTQPFRGRSSSLYQTRLSPFSHHHPDAQQSTWQMGSRGFLSASTLQGLVGRRRQWGNVGSAHGGWAAKHGLAPSRPGALTSLRGVGVGLQIESHLHTTLRGGVRGGRAGPLLILGLQYPHLHSFQAHHLHNPGAPLPLLTPSIFIFCFTRFKAPGPVPGI